MFRNMRPFQFEAQSFDIEKMPSLILYNIKD